MKNFEIWQYERFWNISNECVQGLWLARERARLRPQVVLVFEEEDSQRADKQLYKYTERTLFNKFKMIVDNLHSSRILV